MHYVNYDFLLIILEYSNYEKISPDTPDVPVEFLPFLKQRPELSIFGTKMTKSQSPSQSVVYRCDVCPFETNVQQMYQNHMVEHKSQKDYPCPVCGKIYKTESRLQLHIQTHHTHEQNVFPYVCMYCEKRFKSQAILNNHVKTHFPEQVSCDFCNKNFSSKTSLKRHILSIHSNENFPK